MITSINQPSIQILSLQLVKLPLTEKSLSRHPLSKDFLNNVVMYNILPLVPKVATKELNYLRLLDPINSKVSLRVILMVSRLKNILTLELQLFPILSWIISFILLSENQEESQGLYSNSLTPGSSHPVMTQTSIIQIHCRKLRLVKSFYCLTQETLC